jgi:hypothetical protein
MLRPNETATGAAASPPPPEQSVTESQQSLPHEHFRTPLWSYIRKCRLGVAISAPLIYICFFPFALLDLFISLYQGVCFPIYGIPRVPRTRYFLYDRGRLKYLNLLERVNCIYCSYANGVTGYVTEIAARTEQHWCPIKHSKNLEHLHPRYEGFLPFGDAKAYRERIEEVRRNFRNLPG